MNVTIQRMGWYVMNVTGGTMWYIMKPTEAPIAKETDSYKAPKKIAGKLYLFHSVRRLLVFADIDRFRSLDEIASALYDHRKTLLERQYKAVRYHIIKSVVEGMKK
jgi:hypothetical protein